MTKVRLRSGAVLYVHGKAPKVKGDRFEATKTPPPAAATRERGCLVVDLPGGGRAFECRRGGGGSGGPGAETPKTYKYDPEIHELV